MLTSNSILYNTCLQCSHPLHHINTLKKKKKHTHNILMHHKQMSTLATWITTKVTTNHQWKRETNSSWHHKTTQVTTCNITINNNNVDKTGIQLNNATIFINYAPVHAGKQGRSRAHFQPGSLMPLSVALSLKKK